MSNYLDEINTRRLAKKHGQSLSLDPNDTPRSQEPTPLDYCSDCGALIKSHEQHGSNAFAARDEQIAGLKRELYDEKDRRVSAQEAILNNWVPVVRKLEQELEEARRFSIESLVKILQKADETNGKCFVEEFLQIKQRAETAEARVVRFDEANAGRDAEIAALKRELLEIGEQLEFDRTAVADSMTAANRAIDGRHWLTEGRGSYEWNDDRWHSEFYAAALEIKSALEPLTKIAANWTKCPLKGEDIAAARIDLKQRAEEAEARVKELEQEKTKAVEDYKLLEKFSHNNIRAKIRGTTAAYHVIPVEQFFDEWEDAFEKQESRLAALISAAEPFIDLVKQECRYTIGIWVKPWQFNALAAAVQKAREGKPTPTIQSYYAQQIDWSRRTFGEGKRTLGILQHIRKELAEIEADPSDRFEWLDVAILAMDGYWRNAGGTAESLLPDLLAKQVKNFARQWPAPKSEDEAVEHVRDAKEVPCPGE